MSSEARIVRVWSVLFALSVLFLASVQAQPPVPLVEFPRLPMLNERMFVTQSKASYTIQTPDRSETFVVDVSWGPYGGRIDFVKDTMSEERTMRHAEDEWRRFEGILGWAWEKTTLPKTLVIAIADHHHLLDDDLALARSRQAMQYAREPVQITPGTDPDSFRDILRSPRVQYISQMLRNGGWGMGINSATVESSDGAQDDILVLNLVPVHG